MPPLTGRRFVARLPSVPPFRGSACSFPPRAVKKRARDPPLEGCPRARRTATIHRLVPRTPRRRELHAALPVARPSRHLRPARSRSTARRRVEVDRDHLPVGLTG